MRRARRFHIGAMFGLFVLVAANAVGPRAIAQTSSGADDSYAAQVALQASDLLPGWIDFGPEAASQLPFAGAPSCLGEDPNGHMTGTAVGDGFNQGTFNGVGQNSGLQIWSTVQIAKTPADAQQDLRVVRSARWAACSRMAGQRYDSAYMASQGGQARAGPIRTANPADLALPTQSWVGRQQERLSIGSAVTNVDAVTAFLVVGRVELQAHLLSADRGPPPPSILRAAMLAMIGRATIPPPSHQGPVKIEGPSEPCVAVEASGTESVESNGGVGKGVEGGLESGTGLTAVGQRLSNGKGTASLVVDRSGGPIVSLGLDGEVGGESAAKASGQPPPTVAVGIAPSAHASAAFNSARGVGREWFFPSVSKTIDFINQIGAWYGSHSYLLPRTPLPRTR